MSSVSFLEFLFCRKDIVQGLRDCFNDYLFSHHNEHRLNSKIEDILKNNVFDYAINHQEPIPLRDDDSTIYYRNEVKKRLINGLEELDNLESLYTARVVDLVKNLKVTCCYYDKSNPETCLIISAGKCVEINLKTLERQEMPDGFLSLT